MYFYPKAFWNRAIANYESAISDDTTEDET